MPKGVKQEEPVIKGSRLDWPDIQPYCAWPKCKEKGTEWSVVTIQSDVGPLEVSVLTCRAHETKIGEVRMSQR